jgi:hypothetical protein
VGEGRGGEQRRVHSRSVGLPLNKSHINRRQLLNDTPPSSPALHSSAPSGSLPKLNTGNPNPGSNPGPNPAPLPRNVNPTPQTGNPVNKNPQLGSSPTPPTHPGTPNSGGTPNSPPPTRNPNTGNPNNGNPNNGNPNNAAPTSPCNPRRLLTSSGRNPVNNNPGNISGTPGEEAPEDSELFSPIPRTAQYSTTRLSPRNHAEVYDHKPVTVPEFVPDDFMEDVSSTCRSFVFVVLFLRSFFFFLRCTRTQKPFF